MQIVKISEIMPQHKSRKKCTNVQNLLLIFYKCVYLTNVWAERVDLMFSAHCFLWYPDIHSITTTGEYDYGCEEKSEEKSSEEKSEEKSEKESSKKESAKGKSKSKA
jgi:hypothetical protein